MEPADRESIRAAAVLQLAHRLGIDPALPHLEEALTHPSFANEHRGSDQDVPADNQRLEFLGDAVIGLCVSEILMTTLVGVDEGQLTMMRASLVNAGTLAELAFGVGLHDALRLGRGADATGERVRPNVLADALEAVVGGVYLDAGLPAARQVVERLVAARVEAFVATGGARRDAKSRLQEWLQSRGLLPPRYRITAEEGPPHAREFRVDVVVALDRSLAPDREPDAQASDGTPRWTVVAVGAGRSKKLAEQAAATEALALLEPDR